MHSSPGGVQASHIMVSAPLYAQTPQQSTPSAHRWPSATHDEAAGACMSSSAAR